MKVLYVLFGIALLTQSVATPIENNAVAEQSPSHSLRASFAQAHKATASMDPVKPVKWLDDLGLDERQKDKLREIWRSKRGTVVAMREQVMMERERLKKLMSGDAPASEVTASYRKIRTIQSDLNEIDLQSMLAVREMLTPEQRVKFVEHMSLRGRLGEENPAPPH